eukprot:gene28649-34588_t
MNSKVSVLVVNIDHYMSKFDVQADLDTIHQISKQSPVSCPIVLPYLYFRPENYLHATFDSLQKIVRLLPMLEKCLEELLHMRRQRVAQSMQARQSTENSSTERHFKKRKHINRLEIVKKKSIYGMMTEDIFFIQVFLHDPGDKKRLAEILDEGPLAGISMQTFESHIPYLLQFTSDYNIPPMGWITLNKVKFRPPLPFIANASDAAGQPAVIPSIPLVSPIALQPKLTDPMEEESPIFQALGSATTCPLSAYSPFRSQVQSLQPGFFSQQTVAEDCVWKFRLPTDIQDNQIYQKDVGNGDGVPKGLNAEALVSYNLDEKDQEEVQKLLQGLSEGDLVWSQVPSTPPQPAPPQHPQHSQPVNQSETTVPRPSSVPIMEKDSTCELEIDSHALHIDNINLGKTEFGAELWAEEKARCARLGIKLEAAADMPYTYTMDRLVQAKEKEYYGRLSSLVEKGKALRKNTKDVLKGQQHVARTISAEVFSQFLTAQDHHEVQESLEHGNSNEGKDSLESAFDEWARDTIQFTANEAIMQDSIVQELMSQDDDGIADSLIEDYVKSQKPSQPELSVNIKDYAGKDDDEEEHSQEMIDKEAQDILSSTQLDENHHPLASEVKHALSSKSLPISNGIAIATDNSPIIPYQSGTRVAEICHESNSTGLASPVNLDRELEDSGWLYSTPPTLPPVIPPAKATSSKMIKFDTVKIPAFVRDEQKTDDSRAPDGKKPPLPPARRNERKERAALSLVSALGGKRSLISSSESPPNYISGILRTDSGSAKKSRRAVSFAPTTVESAEALSVIETQVINEEHFSGLNSIGSEMHQATSSSLPLFTDPSGRIRVSTISVSDIQKVNIAIGNTAKSLSLVPTFLPPCGKTLIPLQSLGLPLVINTPAHFSLLDDATKEKKSMQNLSGYAGYQNRSNRNVPYIGSHPEFDGGVACDVLGSDINDASLPKRFRCLVPTFSPPMLANLERSQDKSVKAKAKSSSIVEGAQGTPSSWLKSQIATPTQTPGSSIESQEAKHEIGRASNVENDHMTRLIVLSMELFCCTRKDLLPNPKFDAIQCVVWIADDMLRNASTEQLNRFGGIICIVNGSGAKSASELEMEKHNLFMHLRTSRLPADTLIDLVYSEEGLFQKFLLLVKDIDPDFLVGYENLSQSYGYFIKRGIVLGINAVEQLSRVPREQPSFRNTILSGGIATTDDDGAALDAGDV